MEVEILCISDEFNIDLAPDGTIYGIELLNVNEQLKGPDGGRPVVVDADGRETTLPEATA